MTPDDLLLPPGKQAQLAGYLASVGIADGLQTCIDEAVEQVADYTAGYTFSTTRTNGWTRTLALQLIYQRAGIGVPADIKEAATTTLNELKDVRDGKFDAAPTDATSHRSDGATVTEDVDLDGSLR